VPAKRTKLSSPLRRRKLMAFAGYVMAVSVAVLIGWDHLRPSGRTRDDWSGFDHQSFIVSRVINGDTLQIKHANDPTETIVHLIGIDAPEMKDPATGKPAHWAERALAYLRARAENKRVTLRLEPIETRDSEDRLLAYIYLNDTDCLNLDLVRDGQAYADRRSPHSYHAQYEQAESEARTKLRGLWQGLVENDMPAWRRVWLHSRNQ